MLKKVKRRYLAVKVNSDQMFSSKEFMNTVWNGVLKLYGEYGASRMGLALINYDMEKRLAVIRCSHITLDMVRAALASITKMGDKPVAFHVVTVSGTLKALHEKIGC